MSGIPTEVAQQIQNAARELAFARGALERAQGWENIQAAQAAFEAAEQRMIQASLPVNRGDFSNREGANGSA